MHVETIQVKNPVSQAYQRVRLIIELIADYHAPNFSCSRLFERHYRNQSSVRFGIANELLTHTLVDRKQLN